MRKNKPKFKWVYGVKIFIAPNVLEVGAPVGRSTWEAKQAQADFAKGLPVKNNYI